MGLCGVGLAAGGAWLIVVGGSWYYFLGGIGMLISAFYLAKRSRKGVWVFALVLLGSFIWAAWESGLTYWRWVPRMDVVMLLALGVTLVMPRLRQPFPRKLSYTLSSISLVIFAVVFSLAFLPLNHYQSAVAPGIASESFNTNTASSTNPNVADSPSEEDWPTYGRDNAATRYSPLTQINLSNVENLEKAWVYRTGDTPEERWGAETTPLKVGNKLYLCTAMNDMMAVNAKSGELIWRYRANLDKKDIPYTAACRGVAYYQVPESQQSDGSALCQTRIIEGTLDGRIIAVDANTGEACPDFGNQGQVDIKENMGVTPDGYVAITGAPNIVNGVIITGHQVLDGQARMVPSGVIKGFDAVTGELLWAWDMVKPDIDKVPPPGEHYTRGTPNMWTTATGDNNLGLVYLPMGNSSPDYWSGFRSEVENEYSTALVALDVKTGKPEWKFQTVHKDVWDYDLGSQVTLIDFPKNGNTVPALILPSKQGDIYILDRRTGEPLVGVEERRAPQGGVEPKERSATQPHSLYHTLRRPDLTAKDMWGLTPFDQLACRIQFQMASYKGMFTPPTTESRWIQYPGYNGGSDWGSVAIDPERGLLIANYNDMPNYNRLVPREAVQERGWQTREEQNEQPQSSQNNRRALSESTGFPQAGSPYGININAGWRLPVTGLLCKQPPYGGIRAIELASGKTLWDRPLGTARRNGPFGIPSFLPVNIGTPNNGGSVVTAGDLIFIAAATDNLIRAIDINTGNTVWQDVLPAGGQANPMVYQVDGKQYLVIVAAGHHFMETPKGDYVVAYALPDALNNTD
ncbi:membrane-bound PQQ-dependent dehydrogenase, glucose/quinate/shikimate family [Alteromonas pelagimontana]|uniref:Membrane-bound PQQ-dependent dehydrogenase, glucose/quinate/shikimate family n=2 Tax=Alteromonas pelagimontana TaxID=1858656 RepID=A0A6M4MIG1_9ALTE|nr:membrane-bound PQQ-dependent dehydrogenase, glucose/quinate/shikimate family [Alteromonas pelagimontana]